MGQWLIQTTYVGTSKEGKGGLRIEHDWNIQLGGKCFGVKPEIFAFSMRPAYIARQGS